MFCNYSVECIFEISIPLNTKYESIRDAAKNLRDAMSVDRNESKVRKYLKDLIETLLITVGFSEVVVVGLDTNCCMLQTKMGILVCGSNEEVVIDKLFKLIFSNLPIYLLEYTIGITCILIHRNTGEILRTFNYFRSLKELYNAVNS